jgi:preprotein translocase subunit SecF
MQFIKSDININFTGKRKIGFAVSIALIIISIISLCYRQGLNFGIDFAGGSLVQIKFNNHVGIDSIKSGLNAANLNYSSIQEFGDKKDNEYLIRMNAEVAEQQDFAEILEISLKNIEGQSAEIRRVEMVGPQVGKVLREKALLAMFYALLFISIYISGRFELKWMLSGVMAGALMLAVYLFSLFHVGITFLITAALIITIILFKILNLKYAMGAIVALVHDVAITIGIFSILDKEFTLPIIAALLTIIGYSLNDTIIVFDRIRENSKKSTKKEMENIINKSINETLSRTILTSLTTLAVLTSLFVLGGGIIHDFAFAMIIGVFVGTYSSIFIASPILLALKK